MLIIFFFFFLCVGKLKELMLLGFISLLLTVGQETIADICIPKKLAHSWHPCRNYKGEGSEEYDDPCLKKVIN